MITETEPIEHAGVVTELGLDGRPVVLKSSLEGMDVPVLVNRIQASFKEITPSTTTGKQENWIDALSADNIVIQREPGGDTIFYFQTTPDESETQELWIIHATYATTTPNLQVVRETVDASKNSESPIQRLQERKKTADDWRNKLQPFSNLDKSEQDNVKAVLSELLLKIDEKTNRENSRAEEFDQIELNRAKSEYLARRRNPFGELLNRLFGHK